MALPGNLPVSNGTTRADFYNFKARYYDPEYEHFLTVDPVGEGIYVQDKPALFFDLTGNPIKLQKEMTR